MLGWDTRSCFLAQDYAFPENCLPHEASVQVRLATSMAGNKRGGRRSKPVRQRRTGKRLSPVRPVVLLGRNGVIELMPDRITAKRIGWKGFGLASLPSSWTPPFFVIEALGSKA